VIAVGTEAVARVWSALEATTDAVVLLRLVIDGAEPVADRMTERAVDGQTTATHLAERLVNAGVPFRSAHHQVGEIAKEALDRGLPLSDVAQDRLAHHGPALYAGLDPASVAASANFGGGPGPRSVRTALRAVRAELSGLRAHTAGRRRRWSTAAAMLDNAVADVIGRTIPEELT
jgi:argininosuccinate lyase